MTTRQRAKLRSMGTILEPIVHIGKEGINDNLCKQAWDALEARELIKVTVQKNAPPGRPGSLCRAVPAGTRGTGAGHRQPFRDLPPGQGGFQNSPGGSVKISPGRGRKSSLARAFSRLNFIGKAAGADAFARRQFPRAAAAAAPPPD